MGLEVLRVKFSAQVSAAADACLKGPSSESGLQSRTVRFGIMAEPEPPLRALDELKHRKQVRIRLLTSMGRDQDLKAMVAERKAFTVASKASQKGIKMNIVSVLESFVCLRAAAKRKSECLRAWNTTDSLN